MVLVSAAAGTVAVEVVDLRCSTIGGSESQVGKLPSGRRQEPKAGQDRKKEREAQAVGVGAERGSAGVVAAE